MDDFLDDGGRIFSCDFFDFHAARGARHENDAADAAVHEKTEVKFALNDEAFFDEQALDDTAAGAGLNRHEIHAEHAAGDFSGFIRRMNELDASRLTAATRMNLRLDDDDAGFEMLRTFTRFFLGERDFAARSGNAIASENRLSLIFVNLHS